MRTGKDPPAQIPLLGACFVDCGAQPPAGPRQSGALAPHSTTLARPAEYHAESPQFWSAPRQRRFPTAAGELVLRGYHPPRLIISIFLWLVGSYPTGECKAASLSSE